MGTNNKKSNSTISKEKFIAAAQEALGFTTSIWHQGLFFCWQILSKKNSSPLGFVAKKVDETSIKMRYRGHFSIRSNIYQHVWCEFIILSKGQKHCIKNQEWYKSDFSPIFGLKVLGRSPFIFMKIKKTTYCTKIRWV